jgi:beta-lactamase superfamily II metal-dependent hydrolase
MYDGFEVDMLNLGDADCLLLTWWNGLSNLRVLIDGGNAGDAMAILAFLKHRGVTRLDAIVGTHMHDDHAAGLTRIVESGALQIGRAYVHIPQNHLVMKLVEKALGIAAGTSGADCVEKTLQTSNRLITAIRAKNIPITEPFQGTNIGLSTVAGPSLDYYTEVVAQFQDAEAIRSLDKGTLNHLIADAIDDEFVKTGILAEGGLLDNPTTTAENNSSVILGTIARESKYVFTSDAGAPALKLAAAAYDLTRCFWMQIPHHGSRHNITKELIENFSPNFAYVSAARSKKHPRRAVVNAFKKTGARVYSTHYPSPGHLWNHVGTVPSRSDYGPVASLYEADEAERRMAG